MSGTRKSAESLPVLWLDLMILAVAVMVLIGGITRLTDSGLSITEWRLIGGVVPPMNESAWREKFSLYQGTPQHRLIHPEMTLEGFKGIFWWEYIHRMWGRMLGFLFFFPLIYFSVRGYFDVRRMMLLVTALILGAGQGLLGWFMVQSGLVDRPWVSPLRLTAHLLMAIFLIALLVWNRLEISTGSRGVVWNGRGFIWLKWGIPALSLLLLGQLAFGGLMAGTRAGLDFPTFPTMNGEWIPDGIWRADSGWHNFFENTAWVQFLHRVFGTLLLAGATWVGWRGSQSVVGKWKWAFFGMIFAIWGQFLLGVMTVLHSRGEIPLFWGSFHQAGAILLTVITTTAMFALVKGTVK